MYITAPVFLDLRIDQALAWAAARSDDFEFFDIRGKHASVRVMLYAHVYVHVYMFVYASVHLYRDISRCIRTCIYVYICICTSIYRS